VYDLVLDDDLSGFFVLRGGADNTTTTKGTVATGAAPGRRGRARDGADLLARGLAGTAGAGKKKPGEKNLWLVRLNFYRHFIL
jgi:hypothetical protein